MFQLWWNFYVGLIIICLNFSKNFILFVSRALALTAPTNLHICVEFIDWFANLQEKGKFLHVATIITMNIIDFVWSCKIDCSCSCIPRTRNMAPYHVPGDTGWPATVRMGLKPHAVRFSCKHLEEYPWKNYDFAFFFLPKNFRFLLQCQVQFGLIGN